MFKRSLSFTDKVKFAAFLSKSFHLVRFQNDKLKKKNIMIFGLPEDSSKDLKRTVEDILEEIGLKPAMELSRDGKLKEKTIGQSRLLCPVPVQPITILGQARKLRQSLNFSSVLISPDRSLVDRVEHLDFVFKTCIRRRRRLSQTITATSKEGQFILKTNQ